jgi:hypothetical protein
VNSLVAGRRAGIGLRLHGIALSPLNQAFVVVDEHFWLGDDAPFELPQKFELQQGQFPDTDSAHAGVERVSPEAVAEPFGGDGCGGNKETVHGEAADGK